MTATKGIRNFSWNLWLVELFARTKGMTATKDTRNGPTSAISFGPKDHAPGYVLARHF
jgi:hypothetical protein